MTGRTHLISASILGVAIAARFDLPPPYVFSCIVGTLLPDADTRQSLAGRFLPLWLFFRPHRRNALHSLRGLIGFTVLWGLSTTSCIHSIMFALGYLLHLGLDTLTEQGVPWMWPNPKMFSLAGIVSGASELLILVAFYTIVMIVLSLW